MGAIFQLPVVELGKVASKTASSKTLAQTLETLRAGGIRCIAAHPRGGKVLHEADFSKDCCIVFGSEGAGISESALKQCDDAVCIPMPEKVDSLNVGAAAAVFLYEASRQRRKHVTG